MSQEDPAVMVLMKAKVNLLLHKPFYGQMIARLIMLEAPWTKTAATDGKHLFYNREWILGITRPQLLFVLAHEVLHCCLDHIGRRGRRDKDRSNMAMDYVINYALKREGTGEMPKAGLYSEEYTDEMAWEHVYDLLKKKSVQIEIGFDDHIDADEGGDNENEGQGSGTTTVTVTGKDGPPKLTKEDLEEIRNSVKADMIRVAQSLSPDNVPAGIRRLVNNLLDPKLDWKSLLFSTLSSAMKDDYTYSKLGRRSWYSHFIMPGMSDLPHVEVAVGIDMSGSISQAQATIFLSEVRGIIEAWPNFTLHLWTFDTQVYNYVQITPANIDDFYTYEAKGGGGTMFEANWDFMINNKIEPSRFVMFTDGCPCGSWGNETYVPTLFVVHGNPDVQAPFGVTAHYTDPTNHN